jgi:hypothetical protein
LAGKKRWRSQSDPNYPPAVSLQAIKIVFDEENINMIQPTSADLLNECRGPCCRSVFGLRWVSANTYPVLNAETIASLQKIPEYLIMLKRPAGKRVPLPAKKNRQKAVSFQYLKG